MVMASLAASAGVRFGRAILMVRGAEGVASSVNFYQNALGLSVVRHTDDWAELTCDVAAGASLTTADDDSWAGAAVAGSAEAGGAAFRLNIKAVESEAQLSVGYSPFLSFDVDDMDGAVARCVQMGGKLDGPLQYPSFGKVAALRAPDGHMIALYEPAI